MAEEIPPQKKMAVILEKTAAPKNQWECKQCHQLIPADKTVAYHLVNRVLYGWCEPCFDHRNEVAALGD
jgi:hypothetical protein